jgi:hypothetical protein
LGRRTIKEVNEIRSTAGLPLIKRVKPKVRVRKSNAILPQSKKARHQEVLAGMLNSKGKKVVDKVLNKALNDEDDDQLACLKIVMDRILPSDYINKMKASGNQIQIHISGVDENLLIKEVKPVAEQATLDGEKVDG